MTDGVVHTIVESVHCNKKSSLLTPYLVLGRLKFVVDVMQSNLVCFVEHLITGSFDNLAQDK